MRIDQVRWAVHETSRTQPIAIVRGTYATATNVLVQIESGNVVGYGSACPNEVTGETPESIVRALGALAPALRGREVEKPLHLADAMDRVLPANPAAKAGFDIAFHDALAKSRGLPLVRMLGGTRTSMVTDMTIGLMDLDATIERAREWVARGFRALKLKVGLDAEGDGERVRAVREAVGPDIDLRVDANQGYDHGAALRFARDVAGLGVSFLEQPLPATDLDGMKLLTEASPIPIMADESVLTPKDAMKVRWAAAARAVNLKLMKHGGIQRTLEVNTICESAGFPTMVGCMGETVVSIAAAFHTALALDNVRWADLDSHFHLARDVSEPLRFEAGALHVPPTPGLGLRVDDSLFG